MAGPRIGISQSQHDRGGDQHREQRAQRHRQPAVGGARERHGKVAHVGCPPAGAGRVRCGRNHRPFGMIDDSSGTELSGRGDQSHLVPCLHLRIAARTHGHVAAGRGHDRDRGEGAVELAEAGRPRRGRPRREEQLTGQCDLLYAPAQAGLDHRWRGQVRHVQDRDADLPDRAAHRRVVELRHDAHVGAEPAGEQRGLQRAQVMVLGADHRDGAGQPGAHQDVLGSCAAGDQRHVPRAEHPGKRRIGVVVDDHGRNPGQHQLLDDTQADARQAANDDVPAPVRVRSPHQPSIPQHSRAWITGALGGCVVSQPRSPAAQTR